MKRTVVLLAILVVTARMDVGRGDEIYITRLDINRMRSLGTAVVTYSPPPDIGNIDNVFDAYHATLFRTGIGGEINPAVIQVAFTEAQTIHKMVTVFSHQGGVNAYRWKVEKADTQANMDSQTGSWAEIISWTFAQDWTPCVVDLDPAVTAKIFKLTGERLLGDNHVHLNEWELHAPVTLTSLSVRPPGNAVYVGGTAAHSCDAYDDDGLRCDLSELVTWSSLDPAIASIDPATGVCTGLAEGSTSLRATFNTLQSPPASFEVLPPRTPPAAACGLDVLLQWRDLPRLKAGVEAGMASSYHRAFNIYNTSSDYNRYDSHPNGVGWDVDPVTIRQLTGPGLITRTWMPWKPGPEFKLKFYFDGEITPRLDTTTLEWYDSGIAGHAAIEEPFVGKGTGGAWCYMPLYFQDSLKIESDNRSGLLNFYQMNYLLLPPGTMVETYTGTQTAAQQADWNLAAAVLNAVGDNPGPAGPVVLSASGILAPGGTLVLADAAHEQGVVTRLQLKLNGPSNAQLMGLKLRVFYDGSDDAAIDVPVGEFFGAGRGRIPYKALSLGTDHAGGYYCYLPMPFRAGIRIELENVSAATVDVASAHVEYEPRPVDKTYAYLHAVYRQEQFAAGEDRMYQVLSVPNGEGHYLGCLLTVTPAQNQLGYLEGNDRIVVDGGAKQTLYGTGLEDIFNGGYYYKDPYDGPFSGLLKKASGMTSQYRHRIIDFVPFEESIVVEYQGVDYWGQRYARLYESTAYWYEQPPAILGDVDGNGVVDGLDLTAVITAWETTPADPLWNPAADLDGSGVVGGLDLANVISNWTTAGAAAPPVGPEPTATEGGESGTEPVKSSRRGSGPGNVKRGNGNVRRK